jgi:hypothetical protein
LLDEGHGEESLDERKALVRAAWGYDEKYLRIRADPAMANPDSYEYNCKIKKREEEVTMEACKLKVNLRRSRASNENETPQLPFDPQQNKNDLAVSVPAKRSVITVNDRHY